MQTKLPVRCMSLGVGAQQRVIDALAERHPLHGRDAAALGIDPCKHGRTVERGARLPSDLAVLSRPRRQGVACLQRAGQVTEPATHTAELIEEERIHRRGIRWREMSDQRDGACESCSRLLMRPTPHVAVGGAPHVLDRTPVVTGFLEVVRHLRFDHTRMRAIGLLEPFAESLVQPQAARR